MTRVENGAAARRVVIRQTAVAQGQLAQVGNAAAFTKAIIAVYTESGVAGERAAVDGHGAAIGDAAAHTGEVVREVATGDDHRSAVEDAAAFHPVVAAAGVGERAARDACVPRVGNPGAEGRLVIAHSGVADGHGAEV